MLKEKSSVVHPAQEMSETVVDCRDTRDPDSSHAELVALCSTSLCGDT